MENVTQRQLQKLVDRNVNSEVLEKIQSGFKPDLNRIPNLDGEIYDILPPILNGMIGVYDYKIKRDLRLLGLLVILSGVLPNVTGTYDGNEVGANLNLFVSGPFAAGKGELNKLKIWVELIQKHYEKIFKDEMAVYRQQLNDGVENLEKPVRKWIFIPADNSKSGFIELLAQSGGRGILLDTEADTLTSSFSLEFGNYSDVLRKAYHHETVSFYRRTNKERIDIENPFLSVVIGGTSDQFEKMFFNSSNGLLSRFFIYNVRPIPKFKNVFSGGEATHKTSELIAYKQWILECYLHLGSRTNGTRFRLPQHQQEIFVKYFAMQKDIVTTSLDEEDSGFINRMALGVFKLMMVLTAGRSIGEEAIPDEFICTDNDFYAAIKIYELLREHFFYSFNTLLEGKSKVFRDPKALKERITNLKTQGVSFRKIGKMLGVPLSTVHRIYKGY